MRLFSKYSKFDCDHDILTSQTDGRTDGRMGDLAIRRSA